MVIPCLCSFSARIRGEIVRVLYRYHEKKSPDLFGLGTRGGRYRTRTCDLLHVKQMLYQLS